MLHYSNASSIENSMRYVVIKGGLPGCSGKREGSSTPQSYWVAATLVSVSSERRGGRNNKYNANKCMTMHDMTNRDARCALARYEVVPVKGKTSGKVFLVFRVFGQMNRRGKVASLLCQGCVADKRIAYSDWSPRSEQLSYIRFFDSSYGLFSMIFRSLKEFLKLLLFKLIQKLKL